MLQSSNQVPPTPVPIASATQAPTVNPVPHIPINDNTWAQPKPLMVQQPHGTQLCYIYNTYIMFYLLYIFFISIFCYKLLAFQN